ncbi:MAG: hypothetical protein H5T86_13905, partial [Armatimonadetes bacterium]|nr:hypothetical protein [Armatimonadota bacterium]
MSAWGLALGMAVLAAANMLVNGDFEQGLDGWSTRHPWYEKPQGAGLSKAEVVDGEGINNSKALRMTGEGKRCIVMQVLPAYPGRYRVTGWIRCQGLDTGEAGVLAEWMSHENKWMRGDWAVKLSGTTDWQHFDTVVEAPPGTRSVHFDLLTTEPNSGTVWFDDITFERIPSEGPPPKEPRISAETPAGAEGCLRVSWNSEDLSPSAVRLIVYCQPRAFSSREGLLPAAIADTLGDGTTIYGLENGRTYWLAAVAVDGDGRASALGPATTAKVLDRQPPRPGWLMAHRTAKERTVRLQWWPHLLDFDIATVEFVWRSAEGAQPKVVETVQAAPLYNEARPVFCVEPWISIQIDLPGDGGQVGVRCADRAGNVG